MENTLTPLEKLKKRQRQITEQIRLMQRREKTQARKDDTRRKILIGAHFLKQAEEKGELDNLYRNVKQSITRDNDKRLFELKKTT